MTNAIKISDWISSYAYESGMKTLVVGVSGGIDSAVVSTLCSMTKLKVFAVNLPINQDKVLDSRARKHCEWLRSKFDNVVIEDIDLSESYETFKATFSKFGDSSHLSLANLKSRLRMTALYHIAVNNNGLVVGTGNKVEDFGVGFFTKYGDGGVDISPIGDLLKTQVWSLGKNLGILQEIIDAAPTDGLWEDGRTDEDQLGMSYKLLERAMLNSELIIKYPSLIDSLSESDRQNLSTYEKIRAKSLHKMMPIPVCKFHE